MDIERLRADLAPFGLFLIIFAGGDVINMTAPGREMDRTDVEEFRLALARQDYDEVQSWVATQGASWFSEGISAGVSFRVRAKS